MTAKERCLFFYFVIFSIYFYQNFPINELMKGIIIFYSDKDAEFSNEKVFSGLSAAGLSKKWAENLAMQTFTTDCQTLSQLINFMKDKCQEASADYVVFSYQDLPFLDENLTKKMITSHIEYKSEYTFADGYPYGFTPEILDCGTLGILSEILKTSQIELGQKKVTRTCIYDLIKTDINSFEVEAELAPDDWRLYRFAFHCGSKENFMQSKALFEKIKDKPDLTSNQKAKIASTTIECLKTVPAFYNIQICDRVRSNYTYLPYKKAYQEKYKLDPKNAASMMNFENFSQLVDEIVQFSQKAVVSFSSWGEALLHPSCLEMIEKVLSYKGLSVFIESDGLGVTEEFCDKLKTIVEKSEERNNGWQKIMFAVSLDAATPETFTKLHEGCQNTDYEKALNAVKMLENSIPGMVYPQFVRINENEKELESFYRYWNEKSNPSGGNLIIQKYDDFAGFLPPCKPADLSPLERNPCWHCRRDFTILSNGDVPSCRAFILSGKIGNVFNEPLEEIWHKTDKIIENHINKIYTDKCERCDEFYTYNF